MKILYAIGVLILLYGCGGRHYSNQEKMLQGRWVSGCYEGIITVIEFESGLYTQTRSEYTRGQTKDRCHKELGSKVVNGIYKVGNDSVGSDGTKVFDLDLEFADDPDGLSNLSTVFFVREDKLFFGAEVEDGRAEEIDWEKAFTRL